MSTTQPSADPITDATTDPTTDPTADPTTDAAAGETTSTTAPALMPDAAVVPEPGVMAAVGVEVAKLSSQLVGRIVLPLCVVVPALFPVVIRLASTRPADTLFGRWATTSGYATSLTLLTWAAAYGVPLLVGLFAGDIFASEDRHGTWKTILTRSTSRTRLFAGKAIAATLVVWALYALVGFISVLAGTLVVGHAPLVSLSGQLIGSGHAFGLVMASWGLTLLPVTAFVALGLLFSIASRSSAIGVLGPLLVAIVLQLLETISTGQIARALLLSTPFEAWHVLLTDTPTTRVVIQAILTSLAYTAVFLAIAWYLLRRRDFAGTEIGPAERRRATRQIALTLVAAAAVLIGLGNLGPTALTAARLNTSLAATFGNLAEVRYQWQNHAPADGTIPWQANCTRGGTQPTLATSTDQGAGDDWSCTIVDTRPQDGGGPTILDVTLKATGCYQVQAPAGAVGSLYLNDKNGQSFLNPLFGFDGCLGTP